MLYESDYQILSFLLLLRNRVFGSKTAFKTAERTFLEGKKNCNFGPEKANFEPSRCEALT